MSIRFLALHAGRQRVCPGLLLCALAAIGMSPIAAAHDVLRTCIQHEVRVAIGARHIDVTVDLTFFEEWSTRERRIMDADASGNITRAELESYVKKLAPSLAKELKLQVAGREVPLAPLYNPEVDLLANKGIGPAHHRLRLFFFAATPKLHENDELGIEDHLWPEAKALATSEAEGRDGCIVRAERLVNAAPGLARGDDVRLFKFRCLKPPARQSTVQKVPLGFSPANPFGLFDLGQSPRQSKTPSIQ